MRIWRVRAWIRAVAILGWAILLVQQFFTIHFARLGEVAASEVPLGWAMLVGLALVIRLLVFRPSVTVSGEVVTLQGPLRRVSFARGDVTDVRFTPWGLQFCLRDGSRRLSILFQDTAVLWGEPRWFDVAESVTGVRPPR